jgi:hypothetical protein
MLPFSVDGLWCEGSFSGRSGGVGRAVGDRQMVMIRETLLVGIQKTVVIAFMGSSPNPLIYLHPFTPYYIYFLALPPRLRRRSNYFKTSESLIASILRVIFLRVEEKKGAFSVSEKRVGRTQKILTHYLN